MYSVNCITVSPEKIILTKNSVPYKPKLTLSACGSRGLNVRWYSKNPSIASVDLSTGEIIGKKVGKTEVYVLPCDGDYCCANLTVIVECRIKRFLRDFISKMVGKLIFLSEQLSKKGG